MWQLLDVSVSQLANLHPSLAAGITRRQSEVKDSWALLQRVFRCVTEKRFSEVPSLRVKVQKIIIGSA